MKLGYTIIYVPDVAASLAFAAHQRGELKPADLDSSDSLVFARTR